MLPQAESSQSLSLRDRLRRETADIHRRIEADLPLVRARTTADDLKRLLERFYGFFLPLEPGLATALRSAWPSHASQFNKTERLRDDLLHWGHTEASLAVLPRAFRLPAVDELAAALGVAYVLEGSALGGQVIAKQLEQRLLLSDGRGYSFFANPAVSVRERWHSFCELLETKSSPQGDPVTVQTALQSFRLLYDWLCDDGNAAHD